MLPPSVRRRPEHASGACGGREVGGRAGGRGRAQLAGRDVPNRQTLTKLEDRWTTVDAKPSTEAEEAHRRQARRRRRGPTRPGLRRGPSPEARVGLPRKGRWFLQAALVEACGMKSWIRGARGENTRVQTRAG